MTRRDSQASALGASRSPAKTFAENARRHQLIEVTIELVSSKGAARTSLQDIADAASITKAAVLYHYATKNDVIRAAYDAVRAALIDHMWSAIAAAPTAGAAIDAYLAGLLDYFAEHPSHIRMMTESLLDADLGIDDREKSEARWRPLAEIIERAQQAGEYDSSVDARVHAIMLGGAVDAITSETMTDPSFRLQDAAQALLGVVHQFRS